MSLWGLMAAKARAIFKLSDIFEIKEIKKKYKQIAYIGIFIFIAQLLKISADNSYIENIVDEAETKIDNVFDSLNSLNETKTVGSHHHGPIVQSPNPEESHHDKVG